MGEAYPELVRERDSILLWARSEEEGFGRTLEQGTRLLDDVIARVGDSGTIPATDAFQLHDTFGFPIEVTMDIAAEHGLAVDTAGFDALMEGQRALARRGARADSGAGDLRDRARDLAKDAGFQTDFTGYETLEQHTTVGAVTDGAGERGPRQARRVAVLRHRRRPGRRHRHRRVRGRRLRGARRRRRARRRRPGAARRAERGALHEGERVVARVDRAARTATQANHTATHLLHAALRERLGTHVRQAGSYVGPDKLRFDFAHGERIAPDDLGAIEDRVNEWILRNDPVRPITTTLDEARALGAMALFGEKYGDVVRMVQIGDGDVLARAVRRHARALDGGDRRL